MAWALKFGVWEYIQIHMPPPLPAEPEAAASSVTSGNDTIETRARRVLRQADGVAIMRRYKNVPTEPGNLYFSSVVLVDERNFLHDGSGAGAVKGDPPLYDVPELHVDVWREMALSMGGVEHVKIREGKDVAGGVMWEE